MPRGFAGPKAAFLFSKKGLLLAGELDGESEVLGINSNGVCSWEAVSPKRTRSEELVILVTDWMISLVPSSAEVFTTRGIVKAANLTAGQTVELTSVPSEFAEMIGIDSPQKRFLLREHGEEQEYLIDASLSFVQGIRPNIKKVERDKVRFFCLDHDQARKIAGMAQRWLDSSKERGKVMIGGDRVMVKCRAFARILGLPAWDLPPSPFRSSSQLLRAFLAGYVCSGTLLNRTMDPPYYLQVPLASNFCRFLLNLLRLFGTTPAKIRITNLGTFGFANLYLAEHQIHSLADERVPFVPSRRLSRYATIRAFVKSEGETSALDVKGGDEHWSPVVDLIPIHLAGFLPS